MTTPDIASYDKIVVAFSGGKDSLAAVLDLVERGATKEQLELWHHDIDGETSDLMDWACTKDYCRKVAEALEIPIYFSWKEGGFEREMLRENALTAPICFENPDGSIGRVGGTRGKLNTRRKFPQVSADLSVRWCSAYLKVDVCSAAIRNQERFRGIRTLVVTGERAQESPCRAKYETFENDRADLRNGKKVQRLVDHWRNVHSWKEEAVWAIIERHKINPHPAYHLGWGRLSCMTCIFGSNDQWASVRAIARCKFDRIAAYELEFGVTIQRKKSVVEMADAGSVYPAAKNLAMVRLSKSKEYTAKIKLAHWTAPAGAYGDSAGPV